MEKYRVKIGDQTLIIEVEKITDDDSGGGPVIVDPPASGAMAIGSNTFPWVPLSKFSDIGMKAVRCYCPWHWVCTEKGLFIEPIHQAYTPEAPGVDTYLTNAKAKGIDVLMCFNQCPEWLHPTGDGTGGNNYPPIRPGQNRLDPKSYQEYADFFFQVVARYGSVKHDAGRLKVDTTAQYPNQPTNQKKTGLGLIKMIEIGNEWDRWWEGFDSERYLRPEEHAAMLSACYDAVKSADPSVQVVMAGLTDLNLPYLKAMQRWALVNRPDKSFPADTINVHHYSNLGNLPGDYEPNWQDSGACNPEQDPAFSQINDIVAWAKSIGKKTFVTEFGADTKAPSAMHVKGGETAQAELIVRSFKAYEAAGVAAAYVFTAIDDLGAANGGQFQTCGIMSSQATGYKPKPAYAAIKDLIASRKIV